MPSIAADPRLVASLAASRPHRALNLDTMVELVARLEHPLGINHSSAVKAAYQRALQRRRPTFGDLARELAPHQ